MNGFMEKMSGGRRTGLTDTLAPGPKSMQSSPSIPPPAGRRRLVPVRRVVRSRAPRPHRARRRRPGQRPPGKVIFVPAWQSPHKQDRSAARPRRPSPRHAPARAGRLPLGRGQHVGNRPAPARRIPGRPPNTLPRSLVPKPNCAGCSARTNGRKLHTWAHPEKLAARLTFLVFPRGHDPIEPRPGVRHETLDFHHPGSSTAVREAVRDGRPLAGLVAPAVAEYIRQHRLYGAA